MFIFIASCAPVNNFSKRILSDDYPEDIIKKTTNNIEKKELSKNLDTNIFLNKDILSDIEIILPKFNNNSITQSLINSFDQLGSGFNVASQDLEMRGGGSIIGEEQSGFIREIGAELYHQMLEEEILKQKQKISVEKFITKKNSYQPTIKIPEEIFISEKYIDDLDLRMSIYKRISSIERKEDSDQLMIELVDRFGLLPKPVFNLFKLIELKILCWSNNIDLVEFGRKGIVLGFHNNEPPNPGKILKLGFSHNKQIIIRPDQKIFYDFFGQLNEDRFELIKKIINDIN